ncbi:antibiotic biosynthesis monooxygenase family protein [Nonomuraea dietziae]|uniref:putative quinol monooxygenase n=1 Tax=Nonomuraea dietziae TaxID=65515 RepID=UPI0033CDE3AE
MRPIRANKNPSTKRQADACRSYDDGVIIISGWISVDPDSRDDYLQSCVSVVEQARASSGCLDFALSADLVEAGRINVYERWESGESLDAFRGSGPSDDQAAMVRAAEVARYEISGVGPA